MQVQIGLIFVNFFRSGAILEIPEMIPNKVRQLRGGESNEKGMDNPCIGSVKCGEDNGCHN